jgi:hypothetical protein
MLSTKHQASEVLIRDNYAFGTPNNLVGWQIYTC